MAMTLVQGQRELSYWAINFTMKTKLISLYIKFILGLLALSLSFVVALPQLYSAFTVGRIEVLSEDRGGLPKSFIADWQNAPFAFMFGVFEHICIILFGCVFIGILIFWFLARLDEIRGA